jgi:hypothetical protein
MTFLVSELIDYRHLSGQKIIQYLKKPLKQAFEVTKVQQFPNNQIL